MFLSSKNYIFCFCFQNSAKMVKIKFLRMAGERSYALPTVQAISAAECTRFSQHRYLSRLVRIPQNMAQSPCSWFIRNHDINHTYVSRRLGYALYHSLTESCPIDRFQDHRPAHVLLLVENVCLLCVDWIN